MIGCYQFFYDSASCMFSSEYFLGFSLRSEIMFYPAILRKNECRNRNISCFLYLGYFVGNRIYFRISTHPEIMNFCRALVGKPDTFRNGKVSSRFQIVAPLFQASFKADIINGSFRPDQVQRVLFKRKVIHRTDYAFHPILEIQFLGILVETFNESREKVDACNLPRRMLCQDHCLPPCSTAEIGNKGFVGKIIYKA